MKIKIATNTFQQGDIIGRKLCAMPQGEQKHVGRKRLVLAHSESGHSHGIWEIGRVTEYDWLSRMQRQVVD